MKELSIEQKAKRYDEAIERARNHRDKDGFTLEQYETIDIIFPELKDSEDEKVEMAIFGMVYDSDDELWSSYDVSKSDILAWLEKQGEKGTNGNERDISNLEPPLTIKHAREVLGIKQNDDWSEEDKTMVEDIIEAIDTQYAVTDYNEMVNWLKSLKDRVQPKVELTQLDKNILEAAIAFVEQNNHFNCWRGVDKHTVLSALHSLKPQNTWKPSYEQMNNK